MIAWAGIERLTRGPHRPARRVAARALRPLDEDAGLAQGAGVPGRLGRKA